MIISAGKPLVRELVLSYRSGLSTQTVLVS